MKRKNFDVVGMLLLLFGAGLVFGSCGNSDDYGSNNWLRSCNNEPSNL